MVKSEKRQIKAVGYLLAIADKISMIVADIAARDVEARFLCAMKKGNLL